MADLPVRGGVRHTVTGLILTCLLPGVEVSYVIFQDTESHRSHQEDDIPSRVSDCSPSDYVTIQLEDTQEILKVKKKFIEKVNISQLQLSC